MKYIIWLDGVMFYVTDDETDAKEYEEILKKMGMNYKLEIRKV